MSTIQASVRRRTTLDDAKVDLQDLADQLGGAIVFQAHDKRYEIVGAKDVWNAVRFADQRAGRSVDVLASSLDGLSMLQRSVEVTAPLPQLRKADNSPSERLAAATKECYPTRHHIRLASEAIELLPVRKAPAGPDFIRGCLAEFNAAMEAGQRASALRLLVSSPTTAAAVFLGHDAGLKLELAMRGKQSDEAHGACVHLFLAALSTANQDVAEAVYRVNIATSEVRTHSEPQKDGASMHLTSRRSPSMKGAFWTMGVSFEEKEQRVNVGAVWLGCLPLSFDIQKADLFPGVAGRQEHAIAIDGQVAHRSRRPRP